MRKVSIFLSFIFALAAFAVWAPGSHAFMFYSDATNDQGGCAQCHTGFRDNNNYTSLAEGVDWNDSLHNVHLNNTTIGGPCTNCHDGAGTAGRTVNIGSSANAADGVNAIACTGCHVPEGLRAHHAINGVTLCAGCHPNDPAPQPENVAPPWYGSVINNIVGTNLEPCNANGEEQLAGLAIGLDNDGDNLYDGDDPDCGPAGCTSDAECDNGLFCDGAETCDVATGECLTGMAPCQAGETCDEANDACISGCTDDAQCDNGLFCDGTETCDVATGECLTGMAPCQAGETCDEVNDMCVGQPGDIDLDIARFQVSKTAKLGREIKKLQLTVENPNSGGEAMAPAILTGVQNGDTVYEEERMVFDMAGNGRSRFGFPPFTPTETGTIEWTVVLNDADPDMDRATATTKVK